MAQCNFKYEELKTIYVIGFHDNGVVCYGNNEIPQFRWIDFAVCHRLEDRVNGYFFVEKIKPILRPISDLYKTITHNGKEIVPIVELAKIYKPRLKWLHNGVTAKNELYEFGYDYDFGFFCYYGSLKCHIENQYQLFDYLHELKIDYRGLIDADLAIDVNTLNENPYK